MLWLLCMFYVMWNSVLSSSLCRSLQGVTCCAGTYWNKEKSTCERCPVGYYGSNCSEACDFPHFGEECQGKCNCRSYQCDHITGCLEKINPSKSFLVSYDVTQNHMESTSPRSGITIFFRVATLNGRIMAIQCILNQFLVYCMRKLNVMLKLTIKETG